MSDDDTTIAVRICMAIEYAKKPRHNDREVRLPTFSPTTIAPKPDEKFDYTTPQYRNARCNHRINPANACMRHQTNNKNHPGKCLCTCHVKGYEAP